MEEATIHFNWLAVGAAALSALVMGFIWYNPKVFGAAWMKAAGMTEEKMQGANMALIFGLALLFAAMMCVPITYTVTHGGTEFQTFKHGAFHGALLGILLALPILGTNALFERKSLSYILINAGYWIATMAVMGGILCAWPG